MSYSGIGSSIDGKINIFDVNVNNIRDISFSSNWSSIASEYLLTNLNDLLDEMVILNNNLQIYSTALKKVQEIVIIDKEIADLTNQLSGLDEKKDADLIESITLKIAQLNKQRNSLKAEVDSLLASIGSVYSAASSVGSLTGDSLYAKLTLDEKKFQLAEDRKKMQSEKKDNKQENLHAEKTDDSYGNSKVDGLSSINSNYSGEVLNAKKGFVENGPQAYETWCPLGVSTIVKNMETLYGYTNVSWSTREDGVRLFSGTTPDGVEVKDLVIVAADVQHDIANPNGTFKRGEIVSTSLGDGIVVDLCRLAVDKRKAGGSAHFDIYAAWWDEPYVSQIYGDN